MYCYILSFICDIQVFNTWKCWQCYCFQIIRSYQHFYPSFFSHSSWWKYIKNLKHRGTKLSIKEQLNKLLLVQFFVFCKFWAHLFVEAFDFGNLKWMNSQKIMLTKYSLAKVPIFENNTFCNRILVYNIKRHPNSMMIFWIKCYFVIKENITN